MNIAALVSEAEWRKLSFPCHKDHLVNAFLTPKASHLVTLGLINALGSHCTIVLWRIKIDPCANFASFTLRRLNYFNAVATHTFTVDKITQRRRRRCRCCRRSSFPSSTSTSSSTRSGFRGRTIAGGWDVEGVPPSTPTFCAAATRSRPQTGPRPTCCPLSPSSCKMKWNEKTCMFLTQLKWSFCSSGKVQKWLLIRSVM